MVLVTRHMRSMLVAHWSLEKWHGIQLGLGEDAGFEFLDIALHGDTWVECLL